MDNDSETEDADFRDLTRRAHDEEGTGTGSGTTWALLAIANRIDRLVTILAAKP